MTRKHYTAIAKALADQYPVFDTLHDRELDGRVAQWRSDVLAITATLADLSGYDTNGNRRFDRDRFLAAVGYPGAAASGPITSDEQDFGG